MRRLSIFLSFLIVPATFARTIFQFGNQGISDADLRSGNISISKIPETILAITNNLLSYVGYISLMIILIGALMYIFGGINEEMKSKGKESIKLALIGAVVSWSAWLVVNFILDNF